MEIRCSNCGTLNDNNNQICVNCGNSLININNNNSVQNDVKAIDDIDSNELEKNQNKIKNYQEVSVLKLSIRLMFNMFIFSILVDILGGFFDTLVVENIAKGLSKINFNLGVILDFAFDVVMLVIIMILSIKNVFKRYLPSEDKVDFFITINFLIYFLFRIVVQSLVLFFDKTYSLYSYCAVGISQLILCLIFANYMKYYISKQKTKKDNSRFMSIFNVTITIVMILLCILGIYLRLNNISINI